LNIAQLFGLIQSCTHVFFIDIAQGTGLMQKQSWKGALEKTI